MTNTALRSSHTRIAFALLAALALVACLTGCQPAVESGPAANNAQPAGAEGSAGTAATDESADPSSSSAGEPAYSFALTDVVADPIVPAADLPTSGSLGVFTLSTLEGRAFTQQDIAAKDATVVYFWSTTCGPCVRSLPKLAAFSDRLPANVQLITVCLDGRLNAALAREYLDSAGLGAATLMLLGNQDGSLEALLNNVVYTPTIAFVATDGTVVGDLVVGNPGDFDAAMLRGINDVLAYSGKPAVTLAQA